MGTLPFKRTAVAACGIGVATLIGALTTAAPATAGEAATNQTAGTASATATSYKVNPTTASLSIGVSFGISLAGYTNQVSQAESRGIDLGIIGTTLSAQGCDGGDPTLAADKQPQPLHSDSRDNKPGVQSEPESIDGHTIPVITKQTEANASPYAEANTDTAPVAGTGGLVTITGAHSRATSGLKDGSRDALATVDLGSFGIPGVLELSGLHWSAESKSGAIDSNTGTFGIGALKVLGKALPVSDPIKALENANILLAPLGVQFVIPTSHVSAGILFVDPLMVRIVPSSTRDSITGGILSAIQPARESLYDALLKQDCGNATYITVSDIAVGSITGAGSFSIELGGVNTTAQPLKTTNFLGGVPSLGSNDTFDSGSLGGFTTFDSNNTLSARPTTPPSQVLNDRRGRGPSLAATEKGSRGGKMALVGVLGLVGLLVFAERDRRMMRRAQRIS
ncbi:MAG TPA: hypothetical protein VHD87_17345 [Acidimicrobiales bacterium]|nr:hypothetical protein [Acidimicrobiales bacterium]